MSAHSETMHRTHIMGWEEYNRDYAQEHGMNVSPFRTVYGLVKFVSAVATLLGGIPLMIAIRSLWMIAGSIGLLLIIINMQSFKFLWSNAPWFQTFVGQTVLVLTPIASVVAIWPLPWLGGIGYFVAAILALGYFKNCSTFARTFNIPEREP